MQGKLFLITQSDGNIVAQGKVLNRIGEGIYQCVMAGNPPVGQVVAAVNMQGWLFFDSEDHVAEWLANNVNQPLGAPEEGSDIAPEDLPDGVFDPESPLTPAEQLADHEANSSIPQEPAAAV